MAQKVLRNFRVEDEAWEAFKAHCDRVGVTPSFLLRKYVWRYSEARRAYEEGYSFLPPVEVAQDPPKPPVGAPERRDDGDFRAAEAFVRPVRPLSKAEQAGKGRKSRS